MRRPSCQRGFTMIELLVVIFIMTLALGLSAAVFTRALPSSRLDASVRELTAALKQSRAQAIAKGERRVLVLNLDERRYGPEGKEPRQWPDDVAISVDDPLVGEVVRGEYRFVFHPTGASEGGTVVLSAGKKKLLVDVDPVIGAVVSRPKE